MKLKDFREKLGMNQVEFSSALGMSQGAISKAERGGMEYSFKLLCCLRKVFGFDVNLYLDEKNGGKK